MRVYTCTNFTGHWPVGVAAVIVAPTADDARTMLLQALQNAGLPQNEPLLLNEVPTHVPFVGLLNDGEY